MTTELDHEMYALRMDCAALPGEIILNRAIAESRGLTSVEDAGVRLAMLDRDVIWQDWIGEATRARQYVPQFDRDVAFGKPQKHEGLRLQNSSGVPKLFLYGDIGEPGLTAGDFQHALEMVPDTSAIELHIFSYGGSFHDSMAIHSLIEDRAGDTIGIVDSVAASGASALLMACDAIEMTRGSWLMLHGIQGTLTGTHTAEELQAAADRARKGNDQLFAIYRPRWNGSDQTLRAALATDTWFNEAEAVDSGLADRVTDSVALAAHVSSTNFKYKNTPRTLMLSASAHADRIQLRRRLAELRIHRACLG